MNGKVVLADGTPLAKKSAAVPKALPKVPVAIAGMKPEAIALEALLSALGPGIPIKRAVPHFAVWNPNPGSQRGQTIESLRPDDGLAITFHPQCQMVLVRRKEGALGDYVLVHAQCFKFGLVDFDVLLAEAVK